MAGFKFSGQMEQDSMCKKLCKVVCALTVLAMSLICFMGFYDLAGRAAAFNDYQDPLGVEITTPYDLCDTWLVPLPIIDLGLESAFGDFDEWTSIALDSFDELADAVDEQLDDVLDEDWDEVFDDLVEGASDSFDDLEDWTNADWGIGIAFEGTGWTMMYSFNAFVFLAIAVQSVLLLLAIFVTKLRPCLNCLHCCCLNNIHLIMAIMALVYRYDNVGEACAMNTQSYDAGSNTFAGDADTFGTLAVFSIATYIIFCCFPCYIAGQKAQAQ